MRKGYLVLVIVLISILVLSFGCSNPAPSTTAPASTPKPTASAPASTTAPTALPKPTTTPTATPAPSVKPIDLKYATFLASNHILTKAQWDNFAVPLMEKSGGRVKVTAFYNAALGASAEHYDLVAKGVASVAMTNPTYQTGRFPLWELAYGAVSGSAVRSQKVLVELIKLGWFDKEFADIKILGPIGGPSKGIVLAKKKVITLPDIKGMRIRTTSQFDQMLFQQAQAIPVQMEPGDIYTALDRGLLDGAYYLAASIPSLKFNEVSKYYLDIHIGGSTMMFASNKAMFDSLPKDIQALVEDLGAKAALACSQAYDNQTNSALKTLKDGGMDVYQVSAEEQAKWENLADVAIGAQADQLQAKGLPGRDLLKTIRNLEKTVK